MSIDPDDPRCQPDAYISLNRHLYEVIGLDTTGPSSGMLHVRNCKTEYLTRLTAREATESVLQRAAAPPPETMPAEWAAASASSTRASPPAHPQNAQGGPSEGAPSANR